MSTSSVAADKYTPQNRRSVSFADTPSIHEIPALPQEQQVGGRDARDMDGGGEHDLERGDQQRDTLGDILPSTTAKSRSQPQKVNKNTTRRTRPSRSQSVDSNTSGTSGLRTTAMKNRKDRPSRKTRPRAASVDNTVEELPPRFDKDGRRIRPRDEDPFADGMEDFLKGKGGEMLFGMFNRIAGPSDSRPTRRR